MNISEKNELAHSIKKEDERLMRIAVCDDCQEDALSLKAFLAADEVEVYYKADKLLDNIESNAVYYDLYLLDIYLSNAESGIELAKRIRRLDGEATICFISSSNDFYREAYDLYAVQYLLKPVKEEDMKKLLDRVSRNLIRRKERSFYFKQYGRTVPVPYGKILYISSRGHMLLVYCTDGTVQEYKGKLAELAMQIRGDIFCRCHQSFLVNMYQVDNLEGSELIISGHRVPISRRYFAEIRQRYQEILFEGVD